MTAAITIHFRKPDLTIACVDSLLADGWSPVLVWDNSADGGVSARKLEMRYAGESRLWLVHNNVNLGFGRGMNHALAKLGQRGYAGPVLLVNNDARVRLGLRTAMDEAIVHLNPPTLVSPRVEQDGVEQGWLYYQPWLGLVTKRPLWRSFRYLSGCCLLVNRVDNSAPLFDDDFFMYGEDVELSWRTRRQGGELMLLDDTWVDHVGSASSGQASASYECNMVRSHWMLAQKTSTTMASRIAMYVLRVPLLAARAGVRALRFRSMSPIRALRSIAR